MKQEIKFLIRVLSSLLLLSLMSCGGKQRSLPGSPEEESPLAGQVLQEDSPADSQDSLNLAEASPPSTGSTPPPGVVESPYPSEAPPQVQVASPQVASPQTAPQTESVPVAEAPPAETVPAVSFKKLKPIFAKRCMGCHRALPPKINWLNYDVALEYAQNGLLIERVWNLRDDPQMGMPGSNNSTGMKDEEREIVKNWVDGGAAP